MRLDRNGLRFVLHNLLKLHVHRLPKLGDIKTGHPKRMLDHGVEALAGDLADGLVRHGIEISTKD